MNITQQKELRLLIDKYSKNEGLNHTCISGLNCYKMTAPSTMVSAIYNPLLCLVVEGQKEVAIEQDVYQYSASEFLVVAVDLPVLSRVTQATESEPYLCFSLAISPDILSDLITQIDLDKYRESQNSTSRGLFVGKADDMLTDSILRLARLLDSPQDIAPLAPMVIREIHYRLLQCGYGQTIAQMAIAGSNMQRIAQVINMLKNDFSKSIHIEEMADMAHMSPSSFYYHFKSVTALTPLQFQKRLRLLEARRLMLTEMADATRASYRVGYESPSQFSREYTRMFGAPPMSHIAMLRVIH